MSSVTTPLFKPPSMAASLPSLFTPKPSYPFSSLPSKPLKSLHLSHPLLSWVSLKNKSSPSNLVTFIASTSDWPQQEEEAAGETQALVSDWEGDGLEAGGEEDGVVEEDEYVEPPEDAKLFVGNLPYDITSEMLAELFEKAGTVEICEVIYDRETDRSRGFGFVWMKTIQEAEKGVELFNRYDLNGRYLTVNKAAPKGSRPEHTPRTFEPAFRIYVGNLPWQVDDARLEQVFSEYGKVVEARVVYDRETGRSRGFGFVSMSAQSELNDAVEALDGQSLEGRSLRVNVAEERPRRNSFL